MKSEDIIKEDDIPENECECCCLHKKAYEILKDEILCPKCNQPLEEGGAGYDGYVVVGEGNYYNREHKIGKYPILSCNNCGSDYREIYALMPIPIIYNGNHDIFYTGGKDYLIEDTDKINQSIKEKILPSIEQYTNRIKSGENLESWNLLTWIQYKIEHVIAEFLYENGYKK
jgi:hypothetical protein